MLERAKAVTRYQRWTAVEYARFADELVISVDSASTSAMASRGGGAAASGGVGQTTGGGERRKEPEGGPSRRGKFLVSWF
jgi:hypothetical protein